MLTTYQTQEFFRNFEFHGSGPIIRRSLSLALLHLRVSIEHCPPRSVKVITKNALQTSQAFPFFLLSIYLQNLILESFVEDLADLGTARQFVCADHIPSSFDHLLKISCKRLKHAVGRKPKSEKKLPKCNFSNWSWAQLQIHVKFGLFRIRKKRRTCWVR